MTRFASSGGVIDVAESGSGGTGCAAGGVVGSITSSSHSFSNGAFGASSARLDGIVGVAVGGSSRASFASGVSWSFNHRSIVACSSSHSLSSGTESSTGGTADALPFGESRSPTGNLGV